jgi:hypothetical protein
MELYPLDFFRRTGDQLMVDRELGYLSRRSVMKGVMSRIGQQLVRIRFFSDRACFGLRASQ